MGMFDNLFAQQSEKNFDHDDSKVKKEGGIDDTTPEHADGITVHEEGTPPDGEDGKAALVAHYRAQQQLGVLIGGLHQTMGQYELVSNFAQVAKEHNLSAPVVAAMLATPGFEAAVQRFPQASLYSVVPEHATSGRQCAAMESFEEAQNQIGEDLTAKITGVVDGLDNVLSGLSQLAQELREDLDQAEVDIDATPIDDTEVEDAPVVAVPDESFEQIFQTLGRHLPHVTSFNADDVRADPRTLTQEARGLGFVVQQLGSIAGFDAGPHGLVQALRGDAYISTEGTFGSFGLTKASINDKLQQAKGVLEQLQRIGDSRDEIVQSLRDNVTNMPADMSGDDVTYGALDHVSLMGCYATMTAALIDESIGATNTLLASARTYMTPKF